jgi:hypothetical protein
MGLEPTTSSLGIKITAPLFSQLTKWLRKNQLHATHTVHAVPDLRIAAGRFAGRICFLKFSICNVMPGRNPRLRNPHL